VVKERLGHAKISTTEGYLHTLPEADETALAALAKVRVTVDHAAGEDAAGLEAARLRIQELEAAIVGLTLKFSGSGSGQPTA
jgi:hypothetical protein